MGDVAASKDFPEMEQGDEDVTILANGLKIGEISSTDIQVAINEGNRQGDAFFVVRMGKTGVAMPYQQVIPTDFAKYHTKLHLEDITLEGPCGRSWGVAIRPLNNVVRFGKGWRQFSVENNFREGHQLLFKLVGKSRFVVHFFDYLGKGQATFPPLPPMPAFADQPYAGSPRDEENAGDPPPKPQTVPLARPPIKFEAPIAEPPWKFETPPIAKAPTRPGTPYAKAPPMDSENAKVILSQYFTKVHPNLCTEASNAKVTVKTEDMTEHNFNPSEVLNNDGGVEAKHAGKQGSYKVEATEEGKAYILIDSDDDDDDDEVVKQGTPQLFIRTARKREPFEGMDTIDAGESNLREQTGFHSPEKVRTPRLARKRVHLMPEEQTEYVEQDHFEIHRDAEEDDHFMVSKTCSDSIPLKYRERQRPVGEKTSVRRASWEGKSGHDLSPFAKADSHGHLGPMRDPYEGKTVVRTSARNYGCGEEVRDTRRGLIRGCYEEETVPKSATRNHGYREEFRDHTSPRGAFQRGSDLKGGSMATLSPAKLLLTQQRCMNYSEIVSNCRRRRATDAERQRALTAATRFAAGLKNESFQVVMTEIQVYHGFKLPIPRDFLEVTGTLKANKVKVCLIDSQKTSYDTKWKWHPGGYAPLLNSDGWALFALDHMLEEGDVCVFELTSPGPAFLFTVHIFKVLENSGRDNPIYELHGGQNPARDNSIQELRGGQRAPLNKKFERQAPAASNGDRELTHDRGKKRSFHDLDRPSLQKPTQKPYNLQAWTKLFKPSRVRAHFGGTRGQREF